jgi:hypothetical protein
MVVLHKLLCSVVGLHCRQHRRNLVNNIGGRGVKSTLGIWNINLRSSQVRKMGKDSFEPVLNIQRP